VTLSVPVDLVRLTCPGCGVVFGVPRELYDARAAGGGAVTCPNGGTFRVGLPPRLEQQLTRLTERAARAREDFQTVVEANFRLTEENEKLEAEVAAHRRAHIDQVVGPNTVEGL
jgi:hypothetical protein